jgi:surface polysaccharide O-acyltransferase-like enzyme
LPGFFAELPLFGWFISNGIARIAVPCFFIINGYFAASIIENGRSVKKYLFKFLVIYIVWMTIYTPFYNGCNEGSSPTLSLQFVRFFSPLLQLWYIFALLGGVLLLYLLKRFKISDRALLFLALLSYFYGAFLQRACLFHIDIPTDLTLTNNFIHFGFPFIFGGYYIRKKGFVEKKTASNVYKAIALLLLFIVLGMESYFTYINRTEVSMYFVFPFLCPLLFIAILQIKLPESAISPSDNYISKLSGSIFYIHFLVIFFTKRTFPHISDTVLFFPILFLSMLLSVAVIELNKRIRIFL